MSRKDLTIVFRVPMDIPWISHRISEQGGKAELQRTTKLMIGLCQALNIVHLDWLIQSATKRVALSAKSFLLLDDKKGEKKYNFSMQNTLKRADSMRSQGLTLLGGRSVHVCKGVTGKKVPPAKDFRLIIKAAGGVWLTTLPDPKRKKDFDFSKLVLITSNTDKEAKNQLSTIRAPEVIIQGAKTMTVEVLFHGIMVQDARGFWTM